jgi:hypothetical protein
VSATRKQKTVHVTLRDKPSGVVCFESLRLHRSGRIVVNPTPGLCTQLGDGDTAGAFERILERRSRLARLLFERTFAAGERMRGES